MLDTPASPADAARARFATATEAHLSGTLVEGVELRHVGNDEMIAVADALWREDHRPAGRPDRLFSDEQKARSLELTAVLGEPMMHRLLLMRGGEAIGSYWGMQEPHGRYYMVNTVMRPDAQRLGLYRALLPRVVAAAEAAGFSEIYSRHRADNNAILVPKLKAGFVIAAFEISPKFGILIHLRRYLNEGVVKLAQHRVDGAHGDELRALGALPDPR